jgi:hypothetical protein
MKRMALVVSLSAVLGGACAVHAQMGMDMFTKRLTITKVFHPVVGKGAQYETTKGSGSKPTEMEMAIVGKESVEGKDGYWMQIAFSGENGQKMVGKSLITADDFRPRRMIVDMPGQGAMEMPMNMSAPRANARNEMQEKMNDWHSVGTETITVPAGTFSCEHWQNVKGDQNAWTSDKVYPFGLVKSVGQGDTTVLVKVLDSVPDRITGPVKKFDIQEMMRQKMREQQKP